MVVRISEALAAGLLREQRDKLGEGSAPGELRFTIPGEARGKGRPRFGRGHTYTDARTLTYEKQVKRAAMLALFGRPPIEVPVNVDLTIRLVPPKSESRIRRAAILAGERAHLGRVDVDNVAKAVLDGLNKLAYADDRQIVELTVRKVAASQPGVDVVITPWRAKPRAAA